MQMESGGMGRAEIVANRGRRYGDKGLQIKNLIRNGRC